MRTHGHREGNITLWGLLGIGGGTRRGIAGGMGGLGMDNIPNVGDRGMDAANHYGMCIPM